MRGNNAPLQPPPPPPEPANGVKQGLKTALIDKIVALDLKTQAARDGLTRATANSEAGLVSFYTERRDALQVELADTLSQMNAITP